MISKFSKADNFYNPKLIFKMQIYSKFFILNFYNR